MKLYQQQSLYIPFRDNRSATDNRVDNFAGLYIDVAGRKGHFIVPTYSSDWTDEVPIVYIILLLNLSNLTYPFYHYPQHNAIILRENAMVGLLNQFLASEAQAEGLHDPLVVPPAKVTLLHGEGPAHDYRPIVNDFDSGVAVVTYFDFLFHSCPIVVLQHQWPFLRKRLAVALQMGRFPRDV